MKIVTWNCNLKFANKFEHLESMDADICIIQECEKLKEDYFPNAKFFWTGRIENKGLGVLIKNGSASLDPIHNPNLSDKETFSSTDSDGLIAVDLSFSIISLGIKCLLLDVA